MDESICLNQQEVLQYSLACRVLSLLANNKTKNTDYLVRVYSRSDADVICLHKEYNDFRMIVDDRCQEYSGNNIPFYHGICIPSLGLSQKMYRLKIVLLLDHNICIRMYTM